MNINDVREFLTFNHRGVLVVQKRDGWPQITLVSPGVDDKGRAIISTRGTTYKLKNVRRNPKVSLLVMGEQFSGSKYVQIHGSADIVSLPEAMDLLIYLHRQVRGESKNWDEFLEKMKQEKRHIIRISIEGFGPKVKG